MDEKDTLIRQQLDFIQMALMPRIVTQEPTLRDQFAMAILSGAAAGLNTIHDAEQFAKNVYLMADFMMLAREAE